LTAFFRNAKAEEALNLVTRGERNMKAILIALATLSLVSAVTPASAQDGWRDRDHRRHDRDWRHHHRSGITVDVGRSYARSNCAVKVTKVHRSNGTTVTRRVRSCG
jgi:hypothetical protein